MYTINYEVTCYNMVTMRTQVATFQYRHDAFDYADLCMTNGKVDVKVYAL